VERKQFDPLPLLGALTAQRVEFVIVGGLAGNLHGSARVTYDLDVAYARDVENLERLAAMLSSVHATLRGAPEDLPFLLDAKTLAAGSNFTFATDFGPLDVLGDPAGAPPYSELAAEAEHLDLAGLEVAVASLDHLIRMKEAAGRPQDKLDASEYRALWEEIRAREGR
jgi:hypothetical protein